MENQTTSQYENSYFSKEIHILIAMAYVAITSASIMANVIIWVAICRKRELQSAMNYLVLNLALADLVTSVTIYPYIFIIHVGAVTQEKKTQDILCNVTEGLTPFFIAAGTSLLTLCAISFNRYLAIMYPERQSWRIGKRGAKYFSIFAWIFSTVFMIPGASSYRFDTDVGYCARSWGDINSTAYRISIWLVGMALPLIFLFLSFGAIVLKSRQRNDFIREQIQVEAVRSRRLRKAEKMLGMLILVYIICWIPFCIYWGLTTFSSLFPLDKQGYAASGRWLRTTTIFATLNGLINPFIYALGNKELTSEIKLILRKILHPKCCRNSIEPQIMPIIVGEYHDQKGMTTLNTRYSVRTATSTDTGQ